MKIIKWHKTYTKWWQKKLGMSDYAFLWFSFLKGAAVTLLIVWAIR